MANALKKNNNKKQKQNRNKQKHTKVDVYVAKRGAQRIETVFEQV